MTADSIKVNPVVRVVANLTVAACFGGCTAYLLWLLSAPQWLAIVLGLVVVAVYCMMWFGSTDDALNG